MVHQRPRPHVEKFYLDLKAVHALIVFPRRAEGLLALGALVKPKKEHHWSSIGFAPAGSPARTTSLGKYYVE